MDENIIKIDNISKTYRIQEHEDGKLNFIKNIFIPVHKDYLALNNVSFNIKKSQIVGLIGKNGSGKSTLIKHICGILKPNSGTVNVMGMDPFENRQELCKDIGIVFGHRLQLFWNLPARDTYDVLKKMYKIPNDTFNEMKNIAEDFLDLRQLPNTLTRELSLGQKNKFNFACSILHNPKLLLLDEPTIGLDVLSRIQTRNLLKYLNEKYNTTILVSTHDSSDVDELCEKIIVIDNGEKRLEESTIKFKNLWRNQRQVSIFVEDSNIINELYKKLEKENSFDWIITKQNQNTIKVVFQINDKEYIEKIINSRLNDTAKYEIKYEELSIENILMQMFNSI